MKARASMDDSELLGGRYEILRTVSTGRRASLFQALDHVHDRFVALKIYPVTGDDDRDTLLAEANLLMSIDPHPALPVVRGDFFTAEGDRYVVVLNWIEGIDLQQMLDAHGDPGLPFATVVESLEQVGAALDHLHLHEPTIVHGDVKPANLVRTGNGNVVLVDFDIAGTRGSGGRYGTVGYVAPEVAAGEKPGPAADVFGLAATAVALLDGQPPGDTPPVYPGLDPSQQRRVARVLRTALAVDPAARPVSAARLVEQLRGSQLADLPTGIVALVATEVADAGRLWEEEPDEMRVAMTRLRDLLAEAAEASRGTVVGSMNEGERAIAVFEDARLAALAAIDLHERVEREHFPPAVDVRLRVAVSVGDAELVDGAYTGAVVEHLVGLRELAAPGATIASESAAEALVDAVGRDLSIVPLGSAAAGTRRRGAPVYGLTRAGEEDRAAIETPTLPVRDGSVDGGSTAAESPVVAEAEPGPASRRISRVTVATAALQHTSTLVALTVTGLALVFLIVLSPEFGMRTLSAVIFVIGAIVTGGCFAGRWSIEHQRERSRLEGEELAREREARARQVARERDDQRHRLELGFAAIPTADGAQGAQVVEALAEELDAILDLLDRSAGRPALGLSALMPTLTEETYHRGMSALSDALELLQVADGRQRSRVQDELADVEDRLAQGAYVDDRARTQDEHRRATQAQLLERLDQSRVRARDLVFEAERCEDALHEARIELASVRAGDTEIDVDVVVATLQDTIRRVRDVQDEMRKLSH
jgi:hypothetical protein